MEGSHKTVSVLVVILCYGSFVTISITHAWKEPCANLCHCNITYVLCPAQSALQYVPTVVINGSSREAIIPYMDLRWNRIQSIPDGNFSAFSSLQILYMSENILSTLTPHSFDGLRNLILLNLDRNSLTELLPGQFSDLASLRTLTLKENRLAVLHNTSFAGLGELRTLNLADNNLSSFPSGIFESLGKLEVLTLTSNKLVVLNNDSFSGLDRLRVLYLASNTISRLPSGIFDGLGELELLYIRDNAISSLQSGLFDELTNLTLIYLDENKLTSLPLGIVDKLSKLEVFSGHANLLLGHLHDGIVNGNPSLTEFDFGFNRLTSLHPEMFASTPLLTILRLDYNFITALPLGIFDNLPLLTTFTIANNSFPLNASLCPLITIRKTNAFVDSADSPVLFETAVGLWIKQIVNTKCNGADVRCYGFPGEALGYMCSCPAGTAYNGTACVTIPTCAACTIYPSCHGPPTNFSCDCVLPSTAMLSRNISSGCASARFPCDDGLTFRQTDILTCQSSALDDRPSLSTTPWTSNSTSNTHTPSANPKWTSSGSNTSTPQTVTSDNATIPPVSSTPATTASSEVRSPQYTTSRTAHTNLTHSTNTIPIGSSNNTSPTNTGPLLFSSLSTIPPTTTTSKIPVSSLNNTPTSTTNTFQTSSSNNLPPSSTNTLPISTMNQEVTSTNHTSTEFPSSVPLTSNTHASKPRSPSTAEARNTTRSTENSHTSHVSASSTQLPATSQSRSSQAITSMRNISNTTGRTPPATLQQLSNAQLNASDSQQIVQTSGLLQALTENNITLSSRDIDHAAEVLTNLAIAMNASQSVNHTDWLQVAASVVTTVDNILKQNSSAVSAYTGPRIAQSLETLLFSYTRSAIQSNYTLISIVKPNIALAIGCLNITDQAQLLAALSHGKEVFLGPAEVFTQNTENTTLLVNIPGVVLHQTAAAAAAAQLTSDIYTTNSSMCPTSWTSFIFYKKATLFIDHSLPDNTDVLSGVISVNIGNIVSGDDLQQPANFTFKLVEEEARVVVNTTCVFWDFQSGSWSTEGCRLLTPDENNQDKRAYCQCTHLSNFAVLVSRNVVNQQGPESKAQRALSIVTYIGCALSIASLIAAMSTIACFRSIRNRRHHRIVFCLSTSLLLALLLFTLGVRATANRAACTAIAMLLHFLFLLAFALTSLDAFLLYKQLVNLLTAVNQSTVKVAYVVTAGMPLFIVAISGGIGSFDVYGSGKYCWIANDTVFYVAFISPMCVCLLSNIAVIVRVVVLLRHHRSSAITGKAKDTSSVSYLLRVVVALSVLLGISWLFGALVAVYDHLALQFIFAITNTLQGLGIFLHVSRDVDVRTTWRASIASVLLHFPRLTSTSQRSTNVTGSAGSIPNASTQRPGSRSERNPTVENPAAEGRNLEDRQLSEEDRQLSSQQLSSITSLTPLVGISDTGSQQTSTFRLRSTGEMLELSETQEEGSMDQREEDEEEDIV
ncbi:latrophilin-like protein LAT-2 [Sycon ciliatum]|uniref:latrophilin-like protein LAT-2 n=1 Tax=Sycon ciliatum TaxID=27933 RepID=UPI0031F6B0FA